MKSTKYKHGRRKVKQTLHKENERKKWVKQRAVREKATERRGERIRTRTTTSVRECFKFTAVLRNLNSAE